MDRRPGEYVFKPDDPPCIYIESDTPDPVIKMDDAAKGDPCNCRIERGVQKRQETVFEDDVPTIAIVINEAEKGEPGPAGPAGPQGKDGTSGKSPRLSEGDTWLIYDEVSMEWFDTGLYAGGLAPYIGSNGNWIVGGEDTGVKAQGPQGRDGAAVYNLLDNSDFTQPVNQRGNTSYTSGSEYTIDRWRKNSGIVEVMGSTGIKITSDGTTGVYFTQLFDPSFGSRYNGKVLTFAFMSNLGMSCIKATFSATNGWVYRPAVSANIWATIGQNQNGFPYVDIVVGKNANPLTVYWAALYEGEYTADTLPAYQPKGFAQELAECQRHCWPMDSEYVGYGYGDAYGQIFVDIILPIEMRTNPTVEYTLDAVWGNGLDYTSNSNNRIYVTATTKKVRFNVVTLDAGLKNKPMHVVLSDIKLNAEL